MINRIRKLFFGSITKELFWAIIFCLMLSYLFYTALWSLGGGTLLIENLGAKANEIYIELDRHLWNLEDGEAYINQLAQFYNMSIAITDETGNIKLKDSNTTINHIDLEYIRKIMSGSYNNGDFYQSYDLEVNQRNYKLIVWRETGNSFIQHYNLTQYYFLFTVVFTMIVFAGALYFFIKSKIKYIGYITKTISSISYGNLDNSIELKGNDELTTLAAKINEMTVRLKYTIEQERVSESFKRELITNVSHDLRTPLTSIIGYLELLKNKELADPKKAEYVEILSTRADKLKYLINDLFEFSKLESGGEKLNLSSINLIELIEQCLGEQAASAMKKGISIEKDFAVDEFIVTADAPKLARVFENIISNAIKYSENNTAFEITAAINDADITIIFRNISSINLDSNVKHIFERFYRLDESRSSRIEGSGLGLAIAKGIIELHKGEIWAKAEGNQFVIAIRLKGSLPFLEAN